MTTLTSSSSLFLNIGGSGSSGGDLALHEGTIASESQLGHVKIDNDTIKVNANGQIYVDFGTGEIRKQEFILIPTFVGQDEFEFTMLGYTPEKYVDLLFNNTTKVHGSDYSIEVVDQASFRFKVKLNNPVTNTRVVFNLVLMWQESKHAQSRLTKLEYVVNVSPEDNTVIELPFRTYDPETYIHLLFNNTLKVHDDQYQILPRDTNDLTQGYYIKLNTAPTNPSRAFFNLVFITSGLTSGGGYVDVSRFFEGAFSPFDNSLIWYKTS